MADGIVTWHGGTIAMTEAGGPFVRVVAALFDDHRQETSSGFSAAV